jgi:hypothetical protein
MEICVRHVTPEFSYTSLGACFGGLVLPVPMGGMVVMRKHEVSSVVVLSCSQRYFNALRLSKPDTLRALRLEPHAGSLDCK